MTALLHIQVHAGVTPDMPPSAACVRKRRGNLSQHMRLGGVLQKWDLKEVYYNYKKR